jgi:hypothetical protein
MANFLIGALFTYGIFATLAFMDSEKDLKKLNRTIKAKKNHPSSGVIPMKRKVG